MFALKYDPKITGHYEIEWWKAHHYKDKEKLQKYLLLQTVELYGVGENTAKEMMGLLFAAVKFHDTREWDNAAEQMRHYYELVRARTGLVFDTPLAGKYEVAWWILHDKLEHVLDKTPLAKAFEQLYETIFGVDGILLEKACKERALATYEHDLAEDPETPDEGVEHRWKKAEQHLVNFYTELKRVVSLNRK